MNWTNTILKHLVAYRLGIRVSPNSSLLISEESIKNGIPCSRVNWASHRQPRWGIERGIPAPVVERDPGGREPPGSNTQTFTEDMAQRPVLLGLIPPWRTISPVCIRGANISELPKPSAERQARIMVKEPGLATQLCHFLAVLLHHSGSQFSPSGKWGKYSCLSQGVAVMFKWTNRCKICKSQHSLLVFVVIV